MATSASPRARIADAIADHGPIGFDEFMDLALYGPGGYYERPPVGIEGDFVTSPHVHPVFGELLARGLRELWTHLGGPDPFALVELGGGDGTLARQLLAHLGDLPLHYTAVERSAGARDALRRIDGLAVSEAIPDGDLSVVLGHELLDNLPFRLLRGAAELRVAFDGDRLAMVEAPVPPELADLALGAAAGERVVPTGAIALVADLAPRLRRTYALFIDYGEPDGAGGPVHGYRGHRVVGDVLDRPGSSDITAGVDFGALTRKAVGAGLATFGLVTQSEALRTLGFEDWMRRELAEQGALLNAGRGTEAVRRWAGRSSATILVSPEQLGRMRWWGVSTHGLPRPSFLGGDTPVT